LPVSAISRASVPHSVPATCRAAIFKTPISRQNSASARHFQVPGRVLRARDRKVLQENWQP
jgi:hypothetical protein